MRMGIRILDGELQSTDRVIFDSILRAFRLSLCREFAL